MDGRGGKAPARFICAEGQTAGGSVSSGVSRMRRTSRQTPGERSAASSRAMRRRFSIRYFRVVSASAKANISQ